MRSKQQSKTSDHDQDDLDNTRDALIIRCTRAEAQAIREVAKRERRTITGFVLHVVMNYIGTRETVLKKVREKLDAAKEDRHAKGHAT
ncbi:MAG TPA: hypothetical protein VFJ47_14570 [Terriglobales bacterium]|jgi:uncharacterized protein (DUF1778 family)|nr:hypothetical protein [Terriglobales bacterium]